MSTRVNNGVYSEDVPSDFQRVSEEFDKNESLIKKLENDVEKYKIEGQLDSAACLDRHINILKNNWLDLNKKFKKFQKPADFDQNLNKVKKELEEIEKSMYMIEIYNEDPEALHLQLEHCIKFYKTLSEQKSFIEIVLKQGRSIVEKKQVDNTEELTRHLDNLKLNYNELGSRVTNWKNDLEKAFKLAKKFRREFNLISDFLSKIDGELKKLKENR